MKWRYIGLEQYAIVGDIMTSAQTKELLQKEVWTARKTYQVPL